MNSEESVERFSFAADGGVMLGSKVESLGGLGKVKGCLATELGVQVSYPMPN